MCVLTEQCRKNSVEDPYLVQILHWHVLRLARHHQHAGRWYTCQTPSHAHHSDLLLEMIASDQPHSGTMAVQIYCVVAAGVAGGVALAAVAALAVASVAAGLSASKIALVWLMQQQRSVVQQPACQ